MGRKFDFFTISAIIWAAAAVIGFLIFVLSRLGFLSAPILELTGLMVGILGALGSWLAIAIGATRRGIDDLGKEIVSLRKEFREGFEASMKMQEKHLELLMEIRDRLIP